MLKSTSDKRVVQALVYMLFMIVIFGLLFGLVGHLLRASSVASATIVSIVFEITVISALLAVLPNITHLEP